MVAGEVVRLPTPYAVLRIRASTEPEELTAEQEQAARAAALALRSGIEVRDPTVLEVAWQLAATAKLDAAARLVPFELERVDGTFLRQLAAELEREIDLGRLRVEPEPTPFFKLHDDLLDIDLPPPPRPDRQRETTFFEVRFVDEIGQAIPGLPVEITVNGAPHEVTTNAAGVALLEDVEGGSATVTVPDVAALEEIVLPRWERLRPGSLPVESSTVETVFTGAALPDVPLRAAVPHRVVIKPPVGKLFIELFDRSGRVRHANCPYRIEGPQSFEGTTDDQGRILHESVLPGDYTLKFDVTVDLGDGAPIVETYETQLVTLPMSAGAPQVRLIGAVPVVHLARFRGLLFQKNKSFLLPSSVEALDLLREVYALNNPAELLIVGHTDTTGEPSVNDPLSLERAKNTAAFLKDDVDAWLAMYGTSVPETRRWGPAEDRMMLAAMPDFPSKPPNEDTVRWFQRTRGLQVDGILGPITRRQLITEYMAKDGVSLGGETEGLDITITCHGCGENFPLDDSGQALDTAPAQGKDDALDRRVELFFFDKEFGIVPPPPGENSRPGSTQYPKWLERAQILDEEAIALDEGALRLRILDGKRLKNGASEQFVLEAVEGGFATAQTFGAAQESEGGAVDVLFDPVFGGHTYRLRIEGVEVPYVLVDQIQLEEFGIDVQASDGSPVPFPDEFYPVA